MAGENELVDEERLARQEESRDKGVARAQFGIDGLHHLEPHVSKIAEHTATVGQPSHFETLARQQVHSMNAFCDKRIATTMFAFLQAVGIIIPVARADVTGKDIERGETGIVGAINIAPQTLQRTEGDILMQA